MTPDPRPPKRYKASPQEWRQIRRDKLGPCRVCNRVGPFTEMHHLIGRDLGGPDVRDNLVPLCQTCHVRVEERVPEACRAVADSLTSAELAFVLVEKGPVFFERYYAIREAA